MYQTVKKFPSGVMLGVEVETGTWAVSVRGISHTGLTYEKAMKEVGDENSLVFKEPIPAYYFPERERKPVRVFIVGYSWNDKFLKISFDSTNLENIMGVEISHLIEETESTKKQLQKQWRRIQTAERSLINYDRTFNYLSKYHSVKLPQREVVL